MSLLSKFIRNNLIKALEEELVDMSPQLKDLTLREMRELGQKVVEWAESKIHIDLNGDGKIGEVDE